jgi:acetyl esterase/lipase
MADLSDKDFSELPPLLIQAGGEEILLPASEGWAEKARLAGVEVTLQVFPGMPHVFQVASFLPEAKTAIKKIAAFITQWQE